jgi:hypothetical protein
VSIPIQKICQYTSTSVPYRKTSNVRRVHSYISMQSYIRTRALDAALECSTEYNETKILRCIVDRMSFNESDASSCIASQVLQMCKVEGTKKNQKELCSQVYIPVALYCCIDMA